MIRGLWERETVAVMLLAAVLPVAVTWLLGEGWEGVTRLVFFLLVAGIWHLIWMLARAQPPSFAGALTALAIAVLAPEDLGAMPLILATSFGVVMAELAFGGWGRNVLNPATVTLVFLGFGFPAAPWPDLAVQVGWAAIPAALIGAATGVMPVRTIAGAGLVLVPAVALGLDLTESRTAVLVVVVLLVCDPVAGAVTELGRWLNGMLFGVLVVLFASQWQGVAPVQMGVTAALLASLVAPVLDDLTVALWLARRRRRLG